jgi:hypothetical protein
MVDPQFGSDLRTSLLSGAFCSVRVNRYTFVYVRQKSSVIITENIRVPRTIICRRGDQTLGFRAPLLSAITSLLQTRTMSLLPPIRVGLALYRISRGRHLKNNVMLNFDIKTAQSEVCSPFRCSYICVYYVTSVDCRFPSTRLLY